jgi:phytol kinase
MQWSFMKEIGRKFIHLSILLAILIYAIIERTYGHQKAIITLTGILVLLFFLEYLRLDQHMTLPFLSKFIRDKEEHKMYGAVFFLAGTIIALGVFDYRIALAAILMATFGDLVAAIIGSRFGITKIFRDKTAMGFGSGLLTNLIVGILILAAYYNIVIVISMAAAASIVESFTDEIDDNLVVPIVAGFTGQILSYLF